MLVQNLRHTLRLLRRSPAFTLTAVIILAVGIGGNTAMFSVVAGVLLRPLPYREAAHLVSLWQWDQGRSGAPDANARQSVSPANFRDYVSDNRAFDGLAGYVRTSRILTRSGPAEQLLGESVTWNYFGVLGIQPALGRTFTPEEDRRNTSRVVVCAESLWRSRFAADPNILGRQIVLDGEPHTIVGVMPSTFSALSDFGSTDTVQLFIPAAYSDEQLTNRANRTISVVGRLKATATMTQAQGDLDRISQRLATQYPDTNAQTRAMIAPLGEDLTRQSRVPVLMLLGAVTLVLIIACVNVANLMLARAVEQRREIALRLALGASRGQIMMDVLTRGLVLGVIGGASGLLLGVWTRDLLIAFAPATIPRLQEVSVDVTVLGFATALSLVIGIIVGLVPALHLRNIAPTLRSGSPTVSEGRAVLRWRGALMAAELAAAVVLTAAAGLLVRSLLLLNQVDLGFTADRVLTMRINLPDTQYPTISARIAFFDQLVSRVRNLAGVQRAAFANQFPMRGDWGGLVVVDGPNDTLKEDVDFQAVGGEYFATLGIRVVQGLLFTDADRARGRVAVVSESFAQRLMPDGSPIGRQFRMGGDPPITIVAVVGDMRRQGREAELRPQVYFPVGQVERRPAGPADFAVLATVSPTSLIRLIREEVWAIDPEQPVTNTRTLDEILARSSEERRFNMALLASFAIVALALAMVGSYAVIAHAAAQRKREIGIRVALGATSRQVITLVVKNGLRWSAVGTCVGVLGALGLTRLMRGLLFGIKSNDPVTFITVPIVVMTVALLASVFPARTAARLDPVSALRAE